MGGAKPRSSSMMLGLDMSGRSVWGIRGGAGVLAGVCWGTIGWGTGGLGFGEGTGLAAWAKIVARVLMASNCLSPMLEKGALGEGCCSAWVNSTAAVVAFSVEEGNGIVQLWGKNSTVSAILSCVVLFMYTWWHL